MKPMTTQPRIVQPLRIADAGTATRHVFVRDLILPCSIGVHHHEKHGPQRVRVNLDLAVQEETLDLEDDLTNVVCYESIVAGVRRIATTGHVNLVETLAEQVAAMCLDDRRVRVARVRIEKLDIFPDATSVGVEIERHSPFLRSDSEQV